MSTTDTQARSSTGREEEFTFLFAQLVMQQSNMAMMLMGKVAHPETGSVFKDVEAARLFIDQLEMLETKTKGNLSKDEEALLKQTLMNLRLNFVEAVESTPATTPKSEQKPQAQPAKPIEPAAATSGQPAEEEDHKKKFSKKY